MSTYREMIKIYMFQAGSGDCFLVQINPGSDDEVNILIDCGYNYQNGIKPHLERIISKGKKIDRFIITHYDADHIQGAKILINENGKSDEPILFPIEQVWLNTFRHLQFSKREVHKEINTDCLVQKLIKNDQQLNEENIFGDKSAKQACLLGKELYEKGYCWNKDFDFKAVSPENRNTIFISENVSFKLLTPSFKRLMDLENDFIEFLKKEGFEPTDEKLFDDAFELYSKMRRKNVLKLIGNKVSINKVVSSSSINYFSKSYEYNPDTSIGNGGSISFILQYNDKKLLFMGDAFAEDIEISLKKIYPDNSQYPIVFDAIKLSHHGSFNNCKPSLLKIIDSKHYLFSTNGKIFNHPDIETISCIVNRDSSKIEGPRNLFFNYPLQQIKDFKNEELQNEFNYEYHLETNIIL